ncbi:MAG: hypothetical protein ACE5G2_05910 [Candidatus Krumholzibacteriia bacterium]
MRTLSTMITTTVLLAALTHMAAAQDTRDSDQIAALERRLAAQEMLIRHLLERLEAVEAVHPAELDMLRSASLAGSGEEYVLADFHAGTDLMGNLDGLDERLDLMPTLGGYYDFEYLNDSRSSSPGTFRQHHVSMHLSKEYDDYRAFSEVEFEFGARFEGTGGEDLDEARGEVKLEQAWGEYLHSDLLTLRGGFILTPGHWNVNHYPNVVLSTKRPPMVRKIFPESFVGVMGYGTRYWGDFGLTYRAYVGNGESDFFTKQDDNDGKAFGGRVSFHAPTKGSFETFDVGISGYAEEPSNTESTRTWGLDTQIRTGNYELLVEFATRNAEQDRTGLYVQPSYRITDRLAVFSRYDRIDVQQDGLLQAYTLGINFRPIPPVSSKLEYLACQHSVQEDFNGVLASIAVAY